jgi:hypothetical protein
LILWQIGRNLLIFYAELVCVEQKFAVFFGPISLRRDMGVPCAAMVGAGSSLYDPGSSR